MRTTEIQGFLGNNQLQYLSTIIRKRQQNFMTIAKSIYARTDLYYPLRYDHIDVVSNFAVPVICRSQKIRDALVALCNGNVEIRPVVGGDMTQQPFFSKYIKRHAYAKIINAQIAHEQGLYF